MEAVTDFVSALVLLLNFIVVPGLSYGSQLALGALGITQNTLDHFEDVRDELRKDHMRDVFRTKPRKTSLKKSDDEKDPGVCQSNP